MKVEAMFLRHSRCYVLRVIQSAKHQNLTPRWRVVSVVLYASMVESPWVLPYMESHLQWKTFPSIAQKTNPRLNFHRSLLPEITTRCVKQWFQEWTRRNQVGAINNENRPRLWDFTAGPFLWGWQHWNRSANCGVTCSVASRPPLYRSQDELAQRLLFHKSSALDQFVFAFVVGRKANHARPIESLFDRDSCWNWCDRTRSDTRRVGRPWRVFAAVVRSTDRFRWMAYSRCGWSAFVCDASTTQRHSTSSSVSSNSANAELVWNLTSLRGVWTSCDCIDSWRIAWNQVELLSSFQTRYTYDHWTFAFFHWSIPSTTSTLAWVGHTETWNGVNGSSEMVYSFGLHNLYSSTHTIRANLLWNDCEWRDTVYWLLHCKDWNGASQILLCRFERQETFARCLYVERMVQQYATSTPYSNSALVSWKLSHFLWTDCDYRPRYYRRCASWEELQRNIGWTESQSVGMVEDIGCINTVYGSDRYWSITMGVEWLVCSGYLRKRDSRIWYASISMLAKCLWISNRYLPTPSSRTYVW